MMRSIVGVTGRSSSSRHRWAGLPRQDFAAISAAVEGIVRHNHWQFAKAADREQNPPQEKTFSTSPSIEANINVGCVAGQGRLSAANQHPPWPTVLLFLGRSSVTKVGVRVPFKQRCHA